MRVLLVVSSYLPNLGGLQSVTSRLASETQRRGHSVTVLTQRYPRALPATEEIDGVRVERWLFLTPRLRNLQNGRWDLFLAGLYYFPVTLLHLLWSIARVQPDVVNLHFVGAPAIFLLLTRAVLPFRFVVSLHGDDVEGLPRGTRFDRWVFRAVLRRADAVTACSQYLLNQALAVEPTIAGKARVIYNGADISGARSEVETAGILGVGRLMPSKGWDVLLRALALCQQTGCNIRLTLIGDGPERNSLESLQHDLALDGWVNFRGAQDHAAVERAIWANRVIVIPSRRDSFGLVALEAMAAGKPVVATRVGGLPEVLDGADAALVAPDNPAELAQAISEILARLEREPNYGARNRDIAARFSTARMVDAYQSVYA